MTNFVLDNSVTMRWCFDSGTHANAEGILERIASRRSVAIVPVLWRYEVSAVIARAETRGWLTSAKAADFLNRLDALDVQVDAESSERVLTDVHRIALQYRLTSYDAAYLELAQRRGLPLATLDEELRAACASAGVSVL